MAEFNREETVEELNKISDLYGKKSQAEENLFSLMQKQEGAEKTARRKACGKAQEAAQKAMEGFTAKPALGSVITASQIFPLPNINKKKVKKGAIAGLVFLFVAAVWLFMVITSVKSLGLSFLVVATLFASAILFLMNASDLLDYVRYIDSKKSWYDEFANTDFVREDERFIEECKKIDEDFFSREKEYNKLLLENIAETESEIAEINEKFYGEKVEVLKEINGYDDELKKYTALTPDLHSKASDIAKIINNNRADSLKEAINLAVEEARRDEEEENRRKEAEAALQLERERIAAQYKAAERQAEIMERQVEITRRAAQEQTEILKRQAEEARRAEEKRRISEALDKRQERIDKQYAKRIAHEQCMVCANFSGCRARGTVGCGAFVPRNK